MQEIDSHPGHSPILEPPEGPSALACTCGGLLELKTDTKTVQLNLFHGHLEEIRRESPLA
ncbi:hypothetical protein [Streptomyces lydicus]|uniref:hypothetical protein n=1 Tax=Streptomyces lydicus TaxID=47763 RepID=UPI001F50CCF2|nr:hypothetical protein [Streptomyces lydicus]